MEERLPRKLAAILYADAADYSRLTDDDEEGTHGRLSDYLNRIAAAVERHHGHVVHYAGDAVLAEFGTATDSLICASDIQQELRDRNSKLPDEQRLQFRIGVNLGEVIVDRGDIYGDGVNVAARLESLAEPGGICISGTVRDTVGSRLSLGYEFLGERHVKNIRNAVRVYRVRSDLDPEPFLQRSSPVTRRLTWSVVAGVLVLALGGMVIWLFPIAPKQETPSDTGTTSRVLEKPSIAVLPLENLSGDSEQEFIADGVAESIITSLSKIPEMLVIARNSSFTYKGKPVKVQQVGSELGVRYVLEGSVLRADDRLRLAVQLVESDTGHHVWAEHYDRSMQDFFTLLDEITQEIALALQVKLTHGEQARIWATSARNPEAWSHVSRGLSLKWRMSRENNVRAREHFVRATEIDPNYAFAWAELGGTYWMDLLMRWNDTWEARERLFEYAEKALALDDSLPEAHALMAHAHRVRGNFDKAIAAGQRAVALGPNHASVHASLAYIMVQSGRPDDALVLMSTAMRLHPYYPVYYLAFLAIAQHQASRYEEARLTWQQLIERARGGELPLKTGHFLAIATDLELGRIDAARHHWNEALRHEPRLRLETIEAEAKQLFAYKNLAVVKKLFAPLRDPLVEEQEPRMHVHRGSPRFKFRYPADGRPEPMFGFSKIADIDLPNGEIEVNVWEIPGGVALENVGTAVYAPLLELAGSNLRTVTSETTTTADGTKAHKQEYKWLWRDGDTWLSTISLAAFKEDKWVHIAVHTRRDPRETDWIVDSLSFDVQPEDLASTEIKSGDVPVSGNVYHLRDPEGNSQTIIQVAIGQRFTGKLPDDIDAIAVTVTRLDGTRAPLHLPEPTYFAQFREFEFPLDGPPPLGKYTFTVTAKGATGTATDHQDRNKNIPLPAVETLSPAQNTVIQTKTPTFSWHAFEFTESPLHYRLVIHDDSTEKRVLSLRRRSNAPAYTAPEGLLQPGRSYRWQLRIEDSHEWVKTQNRATTDWITFNMADALD